MTRSVAGAPAASSASRTASRRSRPAAQLAWTTPTEVSDAYDIEWLVLDRGAVDSTTAILDGDRPAWLGAPILEDGDPTEFALYPVARETAE